MSLPSDPLPILLSRGADAFRQAVRAQSRFVNFLAILAVPAVIAVWLSVAKPANVGAFAFWAVTAVLVILQIALYVVSHRYAETVPELHLEKTELEAAQGAMAEAIEGGDLYIRWLETANRLGAFWSTFQGLIANTRPLDDAGLKDACRIALMPMIEAAGILFDFEYGEAWSIAVYQLDEGENVLKPVWWQRTDDHPATGTPRNWRPGDGHVGSAFMQDRILFTTDMTSEEASTLLRPSVTNGRDYDDAVYRSFVSAPILLDVEPEPIRFGVLVLTSDAAGRFDDQNRAIVAHAAQVLADLFHWRRLARRDTQA